MKFHFFNSGLRKRRLENIIGITIPKSVDYTYPPQRNNHQLDSDSRIYRMKRITTPRKSCYNKKTKL